MIIHDQPLMRQPRLFQDFIQLRGCRCYITLEAKLHGACAACPGHGRQRGMAVLLLHSSVSQKVKTGNESANQMLRYFSRFS